MSTEFANTIDVRDIIPRERHPLIFNSFNTLQPGQSLQLINDHDPKPLYFQFESLANGQFSWTYLESGPDVWRVQIGKNTPPASGNCCSGGRCCG
ncbi:MAG: DUF2249 domain-containing protein [Polaromonas sp.]|nr:DUF2249 domain-containing protein [Polaromonas sp.]